ncbi:MAG: DUF47 family protein [Desulfobacterales bacterium]|nr:MAG: DUF47 family protein [Desulfobacterales bacterium]
MLLKKEREVVSLVEKHLDEVKEWLKASSEALSSYLSDDPAKIKHLVLRKAEFHNSLEAERQEIWHRLCHGAYFPIIRGDLFSIVKSVGGIAEAATGSCETFLYLQPEMPIKIKNQLSSQVRSVFLVFRPIHESVLYYLRGDDVLKVIRKNVAEFLKKMAEVNAAASDLKKQIYTSPMDRWQQLQLNQCLESIAVISSKSVETNDRIQLVMVKIVP